MSSAQHRILTTHVGSLIRSPELIEQLLKREAGEPYDDAQLQKSIDAAIDDVVRQQAQIGLDIINDGEFGKSKAWMAYINERLEGIVAHDGRGAVVETILGKDMRDFADYYAETSLSNGKSKVESMYWTVEGPIRYKGHGAIAHEIETLKRAAKGVPHADLFMPAVAPGSIILGGKDDHHNSSEKQLFALAEAVREEYKAIIDAGIVLQVDDATIPPMYDVMVPPASLQDFRRWAELRIDAVNHALEGLPQERIRYHICWGSWHGPHTNDVPVKDIVDLILRVNAGGYSLEMANPRHEHEWRVWENVKLPEGKVLIPGVVSHATPVVEHPELVAERIVRLAKLVGRENVIASTDCGFAQTPASRRVHPSIMWAKLKSLVEGARIASKQLW